jgi:hypothetical protein
MPAAVKKMLTEADRRGMNAKLDRLIAVRAGAVDSTLGAAVDYVKERKRR